MHTVAQIDQNLNTKASSVDLRSTSQANPTYALPIFVHSDLDDFKLTSEEFRVYAHLARRAGSNGEAYPSYASIGEKCFRAELPDASRESLRVKAIKTISGLVSKGLIRKQANAKPDRGSAPNNYWFTPVEEWRGGGNTTLPQGVTPHYGGSNTPLPKGTPNEGTPNEGTPNEKLTNCARSKSKPEQLVSLDSLPISENDCVATDTEPQAALLDAKDEKFIRDVQEPLDGPSTRPEAEPPPTLPPHPPGVAKREPAADLLVAVGVWEKTACELASRFDFGYIEGLVFTWLRDCKKDKKDPAKNIRQVVYRIENDFSGSVTKADRDTELYRRFHPSERPYSLYRDDDSNNAGPEPEEPINPPAVFENPSLPTDAEAAPPSPAPTPSEPQGELSAKWAMFCTYGSGNIPQLKDSRLVKINGGDLPLYALQLANPSEVEWVDKQLKRRLEREISRDLGHKLSLVVEAIPKEDLCGVTA